MGEPGHCPVAVNEIFPWELEAEIRFAASRIFAKCSSCEQFLRDAVYNNFNLQRVFFTLTG